ncbi:MAG: hypothetical protein PHG89_05100 [Gallionella sp.]|nr:hypothetical protein [Gallionella sp.]
MAIEQTYLWDEVPDTWVCPGCLRKKLQCEIETENGRVLRWIVEHHDHMRDYVKAHLKNKHKSWANVCKTHAHPEEINYFLEPIKGFVQRFPKTKICLDCNEVEGRIKTAIKADKYFSFHAHEIRRGFLTSPNKRHTFLEENMRFFEELYAKTFERLVIRRKHMVETLVDEGVSGIGWWGGAIPLTRLFDEEVLLREFPQFDSSLRIKQGLNEGKAVWQGCSWTASEEAKLVQLYDAGSTIRELAKLFGRTEAGITLRLEKLKLHSTASGLE